MLNLKNLSIALGQRPLFTNLSLTIESGEVVTLMGASGSGKSTLLNWMIGDLDPGFSAQGEFWLDDVRRDTLPIELRHIGLLFQDDLLFPHWSVGQNLAFALPAKFHGAQARRHSIEQTLASIGLAGFHDRDPATLSGGQRARISVMRTLLAQPQALLLDEPFSKLDATLRTQFRAFVYEQIERQNIPTLLVTHDPADVPHGGRIIELSNWNHTHV